MLKSERERLRKVISEAVLLLCKNSCLVESPKVSIEGIIGITLGEEDVILVSFKEEAGTEAGTQNVPEQSNSAHELVIARRSESDATGRQRLTRKSKDSAITKIVTQTAEESVETSETEECSSNKIPAKRQRTDSLSKENQTSKAEELKRGLHKGPKTKKPASDQNLDNTAELDSDAWVKAETFNTLSEDFTESNEPSSSIRNESMLVQETTSEDSAASGIPANRPDITNCHTALRSILKLSSELAGATPFDGSDSNCAVKCEDEGTDNDCVFVKSEIFEVTDNQTFDLQLSGGEEFFGEASVPFSESQPLTPAVAQLPSLKSRFMEYVQRGCVVQAYDDSGDSGRDATVTCTVCSAEFARWWDCAEHVDALHIRLLKHTCRECRQSFAWRAQLSRHRLLGRCPMRQKSRPPRSLKSARVTPSA